MTFGYGECYDNKAMNYSVLMSVYSKENPGFLKTALNSILNQTLPTNDFVIVRDGSLPDSLNEVLDEAVKKYPELVHVYGYEKNEGLGYALNFGLPYCRNDIVLRMDSDDFSFPNRAEIQVEKFVEDGVDLSSSQILLFDSDPYKSIGERVVPLTTEEIKRFSQSRSPFNHPSVIFSKAKVMEAGGYKPLLYKEDYFLWIRMIQKGCKVNNIPDPVVAMRINPETFFKRKNKSVYQSGKWLNRYMLKTKYIGRIRYIKNGMINFMRYHLPNWLVSKITKRYWSGNKDQSDPNPQ